MLRTHVQCWKDLDFCGIVVTINGNDHKFSQLAIKAVRHKTFHTNSGSSQDEQVYIGTAWAHLVCV